MRDRMGRKVTTGSCLSRLSGFRYSLSTGTSSMPRGEGTHRARLPVEIYPVTSGPWALLPFLWNSLVSLHDVNEPAEGELN